MNRFAWARVPESRRRYSPVRKDADGMPIIPPITDDVEALVDRAQLAGKLGSEWTPPTFGPCR
jgi:hypothetical protein